MAYLDSAGNVDPNSITTTRNWQEWERAQEAVSRPASGVKVAAPTSAVISGSEKACKGGG